MLESIRVVLVHTSHPGNIGAAARAMKTMGLSRLALVEPADFPCAEATRRAAGADDLLEAATRHATLAEALTGTTLAIATSARQRTLGWPTSEPREAGQLAASEIAGGGEVALVFGRERSGLTNEELDLCQRLVHIPTNPDYGSLNVAAAVQVLSYEMRLACRDHAPAERHDNNTGERPATSEELERYYAHLEETLHRIGFLDPNNPRHMMRRLRRLYARARPEQTEINILRGILTETGRALDNPRPATPEQH